MTCGEVITATVLWSNVGFMVCVAGHKTKLSHYVIEMRNRLIILYHAVDGFSMKLDLNSTVTLCQIKTPYYEMKVHPRPEDLRNSIALHSVLQIKVIACADIELVLGAFCLLES